MITSLKQNKFYLPDDVLLVRGFLYHRNRFGVEIKWTPIALYLGWDKYSGHKFLVGDQIGYYAESAEGLLPHLQEY